MYPQGIATTAKSLPHTLLPTLHRCLKTRSNRRKATRKPRTEGRKVASFQDHNVVTVCARPLSVQDPCSYHSPVVFHQELNDQVMPKPTNDKDEVMMAVITWDMLHILENPDSYESD